MIKNLDSRSINLELKWPEITLKLRFNSLSALTASQVCLASNTSKAAKVIDHLIDGRVQLIFNTPRGKGARTDEGRIRAASVLYGVPCITTLPAAEACVRAMEALRSEPMRVQAMQDRFMAGTASIDR